MTKDERQFISEEKWKNSKGKGTLNLVPRFGKTRIAENIIRKSYEKAKDKQEEFNVIIVGPNIIVKKNAEENLVISPNTYIFTAGELINYTKAHIEKLSCDLLVLDEIDKLLSEESFKSIQKIGYKFILGLTGSDLSKEQKEKLDIIDAPIVDYIGEQDAVANYWIANYEEYNIPIELDEYDKDKYVLYSETIEEVLKQFKGSSDRLNRTFKHKVFKSDFDVALSCFLGKSMINQYGTKKFILPGDLRSILSDLMGYNSSYDLLTDDYSRSRLVWKPENIYETCKKFKNYIKRRNDILVYNKNKINAVIEIIKRNDVPTICFNQSVNMVEDLSNYFPDTSIPYYSQIPSRYIINPETGKYYTTAKGEPKKIGETRLKKFAIDGMRNGYIKQLFTAQALNEGLTIECIEQVITTGGDTNPNTHKQRTARGKSLDYANPDKNCIIINLYINDFVIGDKKIHSRDKAKLKLRQKNSEGLITWIENIEDLPKKVS